MWLWIILAGLSGWVVLASLSNVLAMRRPKGSAHIPLEILIPARDEERNLSGVLAPLAGQGCRVVVFDDESTDRTDDVAREFGATVIVPDGPLPEGWTGKARACQALADQAGESWVVFLDADTRPATNFAERLGAFLSALPEDVRVVSGFPRMLPGSGWEPAYLFWVPWILLATNPFGLVARTRMGHNMFLNGQFSAWRLATLQDLRPFEEVRGEVLDDVNIGRLLARRGIRVEIIDASPILEVRMYEHVAQAWAGMTKNSADVMPGRFGPYVFAGLLLLLGWGWTLGGPFAWLLLASLLASALCANAVVRLPWWIVPLLPFSLAAGAATTLWSAHLKRRGGVVWKGRTYRD